MCGIAGIFAYHNAAPPVDQAELLRIREAMVARGPDGAGLWVSVLETVWYMRNQLLRDADWASMAHSLETHVPLVDSALFRAVAPSCNSTSAPSNLDMAQVSAPPLSDQILQREKTGFSIPVSEWLAQDQPTREKGLKGWAKVVHAG